MPNFEDSFRSRGYRHFDTPPGLIRAKHLATNSHRVEKHAFYPFIRRKVCTPRYDKSLGKVKDKERCVDYGSHADAAIYGWYGALLNERYESLLQSSKELYDIPIAYRKLESQCNIHYAERAFSWVREHLPCTVLCFDIEAFFDTLDHNLLKREWASLLNVERLPKDHFKVFRSITKYSFVPETEIHKQFKGAKRTRRKVKSSTRKRKRCSTKNSTPKRLCSPEEFRLLVRGGGHIHANPRSGKGIPQGSPMSGILSNIYMLPFDRTLQQTIAACGGFAQRYSDDILVVVPSDHVEEAKRAVFAAAQERGLHVHKEGSKLDEKFFGEDCSVKPLPKPVQYLGFTFDGKNIYIRPQTWGRQCRKARSYLRQAAACASKNTYHPKIYRTTLNRRFTDQGKRNFGSYAQRSVNVTSSSAIKKQWRQHKNHVLRWLDDANAKNRKILSG